LRTRVGNERQSSLKGREMPDMLRSERVIEGINDLATLKPLLAQEWSEKNELKPTEVSVASHNGIMKKTLCSRHKYQESR
jgi:hypothetical protein